MHPLMTWKYLKIGLKIFIDGYEANDSGGAVRKGIKRKETPNKCWKTKLKGYFPYFIAMGTICFTKEKFVSQEKQY